MVFHKDLGRLVVRTRRAEEQIETNFERTGLKFGIPIKAWFAAKAVVPFDQRCRAIASGFEQRGQSHLALMKVNGIIPLALCMEKTSR